MQALNQDHWSFVFFFFLTQTTVFPYPVVVPWADNALFFDNSDSYEFLRGNWWPPPIGRVSSFVI